MAIYGDPYNGHLLESLESQQDSEQATSKGKASEERCHTWNNCLHIIAVCVKI